MLSALRKLCTFSLPVGTVPPRLTGSWSGGRALSWKKSRRPRCNGDASWSTPTEL